MLINKLLHHINEIITIFHVKKVGSYMKFFAGSQIAIFSLVRFSRKDRMKTNVYWMATAKLKQLFNSHHAAIIII